MFCFRTKLIRTSFHMWDKCYVLECTGTGIGLIYLVLQDRKVTKWSGKKVCVWARRQTRQCSINSRDSLFSILSMPRVSIPASSSQWTDWQTLPSLIISEYWRRHLHGQGVKPDIEYLINATFRMRGTSPILPHTSSWRGDKLSKVTTDGPLIFAWFKLAYM